MMTRWLMVAGIAFATIVVANKVTFLSNIMNNVSTTSN
jgi:hypothetical protein